MSAAAAGCDADADHAGDGYTVSPPKEAPRNREKGFCSNKDPLLQLPEPGILLAWMEGQPRLDGASQL